MPKGKLISAAASSDGNVKQAISRAPLSPENNAPGQISSAVSSVRAADIQTRLEQTPERPVRQEFPDALVREDVSDLSMASVGSNGKSNRPGALKSPARTPNVERRAHMDPKSEMKYTTGPKNTLYSRGLSSPIVSNQDRAGDILLPPSAFAAIDNFEDLKRRVEPVTSQELQEMYQLLRYIAALLYDNKEL